MEMNKQTIKARIKELRAELMPVIPALEIVASGEAVILGGMLISSGEALGDFLEIVQKSCECMSLQLFLERYEQQERSLKKRLQSRKACKKSCRKK